MSISTSANDSVSVIIPCYNGQEYLAAAIESALAQSHSPLEIIVIDDGSTDDSAQIAAGFDSPVRLIQQTNQGESVARNRGLDEASGDWAAFLDADDLWRPEKLALQLAAANADTLAVHTNYSFFGDQDEAVNLAEIPAEERYDLVRLCTLQNKDFNLSGVIVRNSYPGRFPTWTKYGEDLIYFADILVHEPKGVQLVTRDLVAKRRHQRRQSANPAIQLYWNQSIERWTKDRASEMPSGVAEKIYAGLIHRLVQETRYCYWRRDWTNYWLFRKSLEQYCEHPKVQGLLSQRVYPAWIYKCKDWLDQRGDSSAVIPNEEVS